MSYQLDLRDLRYFEAIAQTGHLGRAAALVHRSQPALTGCVHRLEENLGVKLLEKVGRGIQLTAAGEALVQRARVLRVATEDGLREIANVGKGYAGQVRIGLLPTMARFLMPPLCCLIEKELPEVKIRSLVAQNDVLASLLNAGEADFILTTAIEKNDELIHHDFLDDEAVVIASSTHPVLRKKARLKDLLDYKSLFMVCTGPRKPLIGMGCKARCAANSLAIGKRRNAAERPSRGLPSGLG